MHRIFSVILLVPALAFGEPCTKVVPTKVPCEGVVLPLADAKKCGTCLAVDLPNAQSQAALEVERCRVITAGLYAKLAMANDELISARKAIESTPTMVVRPTPAWYENYPLWFAVGVIVGGAGGGYLVYTSAE